VGEGLGVAEVPVGGGVHLFGVEVERAYQRAQFGEEFLGFGIASGERHGLTSQHEQGGTRRRQTESDLSRNSSV
jgi:hypothetical protein